jgi:branched-chain amino acid transport system permease protein
VIGWIGAMLAAALVAWPIGKICLRFRSDYLAIATIGIAEIIRLVIKSEPALTNGARGISGHSPRPRRHRLHGIAGRLSRSCWRS